MQMPFRMNFAQLCKQVGSAICFDLGLKSTGIERINPPNDNEMEYVDGECSWGRRKRLQSIVQKSGRRDQSRFFRSPAGGVGFQRNEVPRIVYMYI